ncbi:MAG: hypothetical protein Q9171_002070 [Xanthocarpia ochracea]
MACLLALLVRQDSGAEVPDDLGKRILRADGSLRQTLQSWDLDSSDNAGFEVLIPAHLVMLGKYGLQYEFPARPRLMSLYEQKMEKIKPESLYGKDPSTSLYCLEGMIGKVDFDLVAHHKLHGSMLGNPASTAAYLMNTSAWDVDAEAYLRRAMASDGAVEIYPSNLFEITWALKPLIEAFPTDALVSSGLDQIADFVERAFQAQDGFSGFTPGALVDSDSTSATIYILNQLGRDITAEALISHYESLDKFRCYSVERTPSPSANANVLKTLLGLSDPSRNSTQIIKVANYLCDCWSQGEHNDKWNMTPHYTMMLSVQALMMLLHNLDRGSLPHFPRQLLVTKILPVLFGTTVETLQKQNDDGSWGSQSCETTAYAILCLSAAAPLPLCECVSTAIQLAIDNGRAFLLQHIKSWNQPDLVWISKIAYGVGVIAEAFTLAAMRISLYSQCFGKIIEDVCYISKPSLNTIQKISDLPFFAGMPDWMASACIVEGYLHLPLFDAARQAVITQGAVKQQRHFNILPFALIACSHSTGAFLTPEVNLDFMVICALVYEVDHYMEDIIGGFKDVEAQEVEQVVHEIFKESCLHRPMKSQTECMTEHQESGTQRSRLLERIKMTLRPGISWVLSRPKVLSSSKYDQALLRRELKAFYMCQITSVYESLSLASSCKPQHSSSLIQEPYHGWVHTASSSHVAGRVTFAFLTCLLGASMDGQDCFHSAEAKYLAQDLNMHLSNLARMENDIGSVVRDRKENNLNSVDFPEFDTTAKEDDLQGRIEQLKRLAAYERECSKVALANLSELGVNDKVIKGLKAFCNAVDLFGQIYAMEDTVIALRLERCS